MPRHVPWVGWCFSEALPSLLLDACPLQIEPNSLTALQLSKASRKIQLSMMGHLRGRWASDPVHLGPCICEVIAFMYDPTANAPLLVR